MLLPFDPPDDDADPVPAPKAEVRPDPGFGGDPGPVTLLLGPPRGGKTRVLLDRYLAAYRAGLTNGRVGRCVWITPNRLSREAVAADLAAAVGGPLLGHGVLTFENLTDTLLAEAPGARRRRLGAVSRRRVLRAVVDGALARGELSHFAGIARTAGFLGLLDRQIRSWKYEEVRPDQVDAAGSPARRELALLYEAYQRRLRTPPDGGPPLYDAEGRVWAARTLLADSVRDGEPRYDIVVADGFTSFTATQRDLLAGLAVRSRETLLALPLGDGGDDANRAALYSRAEETAGSLRARFAEAGRPAVTRLPRTGAAGRRPRAPRRRPLRRPGRSRPAPRRPAGRADHRGGGGDPRCGSPGLRGGGENAAAGRRAGGPGGRRGPVAE